MKRILCYIKTIISSIQGGFPFNYPVSGHTFVDEEEYQNCKVTISRCENCGKVDISWSKKY
jgi:hypothetical protein